MFLSKLVPEVRSQLVRKDLGSVYELHRTIWRAFPDGDPGRILFRVDIPRLGSTPVVLVQSNHEPDWSKLPLGYLKTSPEWKPFQPCFSIGQVLGFRLRANPTLRVHANNQALGTQWAGKRVALFQENDLLDWLERKAKVGGFALGETPGAPANWGIRVTPEPRVFTGKPGHGGWFQSVLFEGRIRVWEPDKFLETLALGLGSAKGFGFGLLSVVPVP